jgi:hypothetical protein
MSFEKSYIIHNPAIVQRAESNPDQEMNLIMRKRVLEGAILEITERVFLPFDGIFDNWKGFLSTLDKSVKNQFLRKVVIYGEKNNEYVLGFSISIDWDMHKILCKEIPIHNVPKNKSMADYVEAAIPDIEDFINMKIREHSPDRLVSFFWWNPCDENTQKKWSSIAGTGQLTRDQDEKIKNFNSKFRGLSFELNGLPEVTCAAGSI